MKQEEHMTFELTCLNDRLAMALDCQSKAIDATSSVHIVGHSGATNEPTHEPQESATVLRQQHDLCVGTYMQTVWVGKHAETCVKHDFE